MSLARLDIFDDFKVASNPLVIIHHKAFSTTVSIKFKYLYKFFNFYLLFKNIKLINIFIYRCHHVSAVKCDTVTQYAFLIIMQKYAKVLISSNLLKFMLWFFLIVLIRKLMIILCRMEVT